MKTYVEWYKDNCKKNNEKINKDFIKWISKIENKVVLMYGITLLDLPDEDYMDNFIIKTSPETMADIIFENNKF